MDDYELSFDCPWCEKPLLVGTRTLKQDKARAERQRSERIEAAARLVLSGFVDCHGDPPPVMVKASVIEELRKALSLDGVSTREGE